MSLASNLVSNIAQEVRIAGRQLRRAPDFALTVVLTLALGMGATTAVFSIVEQTLLARLPYRDPGRIVALHAVNHKVGREIRRVTGGDYEDLRRSGIFAATAQFEGGEAGVQLVDHAAFTTAQWVSPGFLSVVGVRPWLGVDLDPVRAPHQALVSAAFADAEMGGAAIAVGRLLHAEGESYQVVGVMPRGFDYPEGTSIWLGRPEVPENVNRDSWNYQAIARAHTTSAGPQGDLTAAQQRLDAISSRLAQQFPVSHDQVQLRAVPLQQALTGNVRTSLWLWLAAVGVLLLIACGNLAHLQLVRFSGRQQAMAVRQALGGSRVRIAAGVLVEAGLLSAIGGALGLLLAIPATALLGRLLAAQLPRPIAAAPDLRILGFALLVTTLVTFISAAWPAWWAAHRDPAAVLQRSTRSGGTDRGTALARRSLLALELALSFLLVVTASLLVRTLEHLRTVDLGFASANRLVVYAHAPARGWDESMRRIGELAALTENLRALPGVVSAAQTVGLPQGTFGSNGYYAVVSRKQAMGEGPQAVFSLAGPGYFRTMDIPLLRGRDINAADTMQSTAVVVLSASAARDAFGAADPLGQQIVCGLDQQSMDRPMTVIGIVGDVRQDTPASPQGPALYLALAQHPYHANEVQIVLDTAVAPASLIPAVAARIHAADATIATRFTTMDDALALSTEPQRLRSQLVTTFALLALLLSAVGVYSVTSYTVAQQTREIGIRMALGADRRMVARQVLRATLRSGAVGIVLGTVASLTVARLLGSFLVGVESADIVSYAAGASVLMAAVALAALVPARRAASIEPVVALRTE